MLMRAISRILRNAEGDPTGGGGAGTETGGGGQGGGTSTPWYGEIPADRPQEFRDWVQSKNFADPVTALEAFYNTNKLLGVPAEQIIRLPKPDDTEAWGQVWNRLGRPETPEGYELPVPEGDNGEFAKVAAQWFHQAGVPKAAAQQIAKAVNEYSAQQAAARVEQLKAESEKELSELKAEWGNDYARREELARRGLRAYGQKAGFEPADLEAFELAVGTAKMLKMFALLGETTNEHDFGGSGDGGGGLTPARAKQKLNDLRQQRIEGKITQDDYLREADKLAQIAARAA